MFDDIKVIVLSIIDNLGPLASGAIIGIIAAVIFCAVVLSVGGYVCN